MWSSDSCYPSWIASVAKAGTGEWIPGNLGVIWESNGTYLTHSSCAVMSNAPKCPTLSSSGGVALLQGMVGSAAWLHCVALCRKNITNQVSFYTWFNLTPARQQQALSLPYFAVPHFTPYNNIPPLHSQLISSWS